MTDMLNGWTNCTPGELDRLEHRLKLAHLWQLGFKAALVTVLSGAIGLSTWGVVSALSPSSDFAAPTPPPANTAPIKHTIQNAD